MAVLLALPVCRSPQFLTNARDNWVPGAAQHCLTHLHNLSMERTLKLWAEQGLEHRQEHCSSSELRWSHKNIAPDKPLTLPLWIRWEQYVPHFLASLHNLTFVQIGANCGMNHITCAGSGDPIWEYATRCGWRGVAVEATFHTFLQLCENYATFPSVTPLRAAISNVSGVIDMVTFNPARHHGFTLTEMNHMFEPQSIRDQGLVKTRTRGQLEKAPMLTMSQLWAQSVQLLALTSTVDILVIDIEGMEARLLCEGMLPLPLPRLLLFEHKNLRPSDQACIHTKLRLQGFSVLADFHHWPGIAKREYNQGVDAAENPDFYGTDRLYGRRLSVS